MFVIAGYPVGVAVVVLAAIYVLLGLMGAVASIGASELVGLFLILLGALVFGGSYGLRRRLSWAHREARVSGVLCILFGLLLLVSGLYLQGIGSVAFGVAEFYVAKKHSPEGAGLTPAPTYENEMGGADQGRS